ncbi:MAG: hypothetical protein ACK58X_11800, partial [Planctomycetota bacterium]
MNTIVTCVRPLGRVPIPLHAAASAVSRAAATRARTSCGAAVSRAAGRDDTPPRNPMSALAT